MHKASVPIGSGPAISVDVHNVANIGGVLLLETLTAYKR